MNLCGGEDGPQYSFISDEHLRASWRRCQTFRPMEERVTFERFCRTEVETALERHRLLIEDFREAARQFEPVLSKNRLHVVLTDSNVMILDHAGDRGTLDAKLLGAVSTGTDMSERAIGTAGMNLAMAAGRPVQVVGGEHYLLQHSTVHCSAAPICTPMGHLMGAINVASYEGEPVLGAPIIASAMVSRMAFMQLARLGGSLIKLSFPDGLASDAIMAVSDHGQILGLTSSAASNFTGSSLVWPELSFSTLFEDSYDSTFSRLKALGSATISTTSGLPIHVTMCGRPQPSRTARIAVPPAIPAGSKVFFGDAGLDKRVATAARALTGGMQVLLRGETGVGKEVVARHLHDITRGPSKPFVAINCAALPEHLIEAELFGYGDGAFTGAKKGGAAGKFEMAHGGTIFLDEIGDMPQQLQTSLLRVLDSREISRLGGGAVKVDVQVISATHQPLESMVANKVFRSDLFYRLDGYALHIPALAKRDGFEQMIAHLVHDVCGHLPGITVGAIHALRARDLTGNIREALSILKRAILYADGAVIDTHHLHEEVQHGEAAPTLSRLGQVPTPPHDNPSNQAHHLGDIENHTIKSALKLTAGNVSRAASALGISKSTLQRRIRASEDITTYLKMARRN
jgi:transcriptional regulator of acetoin/glycerol metabolism